jgi:predicted Zn-dependent protease
LQRRYSEAIDQLRVALSLKPDHRPSKLRLAWALALAGNAKAALTGLASTGPRDDHDWRWLEYAALVNGALGRTQDAAGYWSRISALSGEQFVSAWSLARAASAADDPVAAIDWLGKAFKTGSTSLPFIPVTPAFDSLRDNDAFQRFLNHPGAPLSASG